MTVLKSWFNAGESLIRIREGANSAFHTIRIATAYFSVKGWNYIRSYTKDKKVYILVSLDDFSRERTRSSIINEFLKGLRTGINVDRRQAVQDLVNKIKSEEFGIVDARSTGHHNKLYIFDEFQAIQTSSNLSGKGLKEQVEGGTIITSKREIIALIKEFDRYFEQAQDLTKDLLIVLEKWLQFASPWDIYLKTMLCLENIELPSTHYQKEPTLYQKDMIARSLKQIKDYGGSMLIASTGLGKTVVGVYVALKLKEEGLIDNVMIISPKAIISNWHNEMLESSLSNCLFVTQTFDKSSPKQDGNLLRYEEILKRTKNLKWLLIIDECHEFRNRYKKENYGDSEDKWIERKCFIRLRNLIDSGNVRTLLLTASPYATKLENINNQLYLIPHTAPSKNYFAEKLPELAHLFQEKESNSWIVDNSEQLKNLPVVSQLTTPYIAKHYATKENDNYYLMFKSEKRYIPHIRLHHIKFNLILEKELSNAINSGIFQIENNLHKNTFHTMIKVAWSSSPLALKQVLESIANTPGGKHSYKAQFRVSRQQREAILKPIINNLINIAKEGDIKIRALFKILENILKRQEKLIIYCERRFTVIYIYEQLKQKFPDLKIASTIEQSSDEEDVKMKNSKAIDKIIKQFAPIANNNDEDNYDIFISTDAQGVGVNMQDASVVINYDISWTPINPIQRAGRILRFWHEPRTIDVYTFVPKMSQENDIKQELVNVERRWQELMKRHDESGKVVEIPVLTESDTENIELPELSSSVTIESGMIDIDDLANKDISDYYQHTSNLQFHRDYAQTLPDDLISAKVYHREHPSLYLLLRYHNNYYPVLYQTTKKNIIEPETVKLLTAIACEEQTEIATVNYDMVEELSNECLQKWCEQKQFDTEDVERICTLYLKPKTEEDNIKNLFV